MPTSCTSGWYESTYYEDDLISVLQPSGVIDCYKTNSDALSSAEQELAILVELTMLLGLIFLFYVMARSWNKFKLDWYRLIGFYVLATIGVPVSIMLGPQRGGFNRVVGFGILVHNLAEIFIIGHIWWGSLKRGYSNRFLGIVVLLYVWIIMALITFLPKTPLFFILMLQGATCDWTLVFTFLYLGYWMDRSAAGGLQHRQSLGCYGKLGTVAAILHISSIQPLFFGFATTYSLLNVFTVILLVPTFIIYIWFAAADKSESPLIISENDTSRDMMSKQRNDLLLQILKQETVTELKSRNNGYLSVKPIQNRNEESNQLLEKTPLNIDKITTYGDVINSGLIQMDSKGTKWVKIIFGIGFTIAVLNSLIVFVSPCYIDVKPLIGCD